MSTNTTTRTSDSMAGFALSGSLAALQDKRAEASNWDPAQAKTRAEADVVAFKTEVDPDERRRLGADITLRARANVEYGLEAMAIAPEQTRALLRQDLIHHEAGVRAEAENIAYRKTHEYDPPDTDNWRFSYKGHDLLARQLKPGVVEVRDATGHFVLFPAEADLILQWEVEQRELAIARGDVFDVRQAAQLDVKAMMQIAGDESRATALTSMGWTAVSNSQYSEELRQVAPTVFHLAGALQGAESRKQEQQQAERDGACGDTRAEDGAIDRKHLLAQVRAIVKPPIEAHREQNVTQESAERLATAAFAGHNKPNIAGGQAPHITQSSAMAGLDVKAETSRIALDAACAMAMYRTMSPIDRFGSVGHYNKAVGLADEAGEYGHRASLTGGDRPALRVPQLLMLDKALEAAYEKAWTTAEHRHIQAKTRTNVIDFEPQAPRHRAPDDAPWLRSEAQRSVGERDPEQDVKMRLLNAATQGEMSKVVNATTVRANNEAFLGIAQRLVGEQSLAEALRHGPDDALASHGKFIGTRSLTTYFELHSGKIGFEDRAISLRTSSNASQVVEVMLDQALLRQWASVRVQGSEDFKREAWVAAEARGIRATGYEPTQADVSLAKAERTRLVDVVVNANLATGWWTPEQAETERKRADPAVAQGTRTAQAVASMDRLERESAQRSGAGDTLTGVGRLARDDGMSRDLVIAVVARARDMLVTRESLQPIRSESASRHQASKTGARAAPDPER